MYVLSISSVSEVMMVWQKYIFTLIVVLFLYFCFFSSVTFRGASFGRTTFLVETTSVIRYLINSCPIISKCCHSSFYLSFLSKCCFKIAQKSSKIWATIRNQFCCQDNLKGRHLPGHTGNSNESVKLSKRQKSQNSTKCRSLKCVFAWTTLLGKRIMCMDLLSNNDITLIQV